MFEIVRNIGAFIVALGILVAVHEWGHFYVARKCGVFVKRFSIGFGKPLWRRVDKHGTEFVIAGIPLGGYVSMLDERIEDVPAEKAHMSFNQQHVFKRMAIIAAGPGINFVFAIFALWIMYLIDFETIKPVVGEVAPSSIAQDSGLAVGDEILAVGDRVTIDWSAANLELVSYVGEASIPVKVKTLSGVTQQVDLNIEQWTFDPDKVSPLTSLGITPFRPDATLEVAALWPDSPAAKAGVQVGDQLVTLNGIKIDNWQHLVETIQGLNGHTVVLAVNRAGNEQLLSATITGRQTPDGEVGYLGVGPKFEEWPPGFVFTHQYGVVEAVGKATDKTWRLMTLSIEMIGKLFTGDVSVKNLSGPISIAQGAGTSAGYGLVYFLSFLALISVNLGIINLLPLPMLDGGHLMYFTIEWLTGKPVSDEVQEWGFRVGGVLLFAVMSIAIFNDIARLT